MSLLHAIVMGSAIAGVALVVAILPEPAGVKVGRSCTDGSLFISQPCQEFTVQSNQNNTYKTTRRGLPKRREGGGTRFV